MCVWLSQSMHVSMLSEYQSGAFSPADLGDVCAPSPLLLWQVAAVIQSVLGASVPPVQPLMEAGLDSLGAVELRNALSARFSIELAPTVTFDYPSIAALAGHLAAMPGLAGAVSPAELSSEPAAQPRKDRSRHRNRQRPRATGPRLEAAAAQSQARLHLGRCTADNAMAWNMLTSTASSSQSCSMCRIP